LKNKGMAYRERICAEILDVRNSCKDGKTTSIASTVPKYFIYF
jgi:hypothetical protein